MKKIPFLLLSFLLPLAILAAAANPPARLTIELRDGSRVVGNALEDTLSFHAAALGDMKLPWAGIRAIEYAADTGATRLTATNGDGFTIQFAGETLGVQTGFGKTELPVKQIRSLKVTPPPRPAATATAADETGSRLTIELRDGSHMIGKGLDDALNFHSPAMGDLKLTWPGIRSLEYAGTNTGLAQLTTTNGDVYEVQFVTSAVRVATSFGKSELPVNLIRSIKVSATGRPGQPPPGLVALWSGEGDGIDSVGGIMATLTDITFADGKGGRAFSFNGTSSSIKIPANPVLDIGAGDGFTIMAWIKPEGSAGMPVIEWGSSSYGLQLWAESGGRLLGNIIDTSGVNHVLISRYGLFNHDYFQHVVLTYDKPSGLALLYCNGVAVASANFGNIVPQTSCPLNLGLRTMTGEKFKGLLCKVGFYNRALSAEEIKSICREDNQGELPPLPTSPNPQMPMNGIYRNGPVYRSSAGIGE